MKKLLLLALVAITLSLSAHAQDEKYITVPYYKRWSLTLGPQAGVGITPKGVQPYAGFGLTFGYSF